VQALTGGVPTTPQELSALRARRSELSNQLESAAGRRNRLAERLKTADPAERPGLTERIGVLDQRMVQLESDIAITGRQLTAAPASLLASTSDADKVFGVLNGGMITGMSVVFTIFVLAPLALAASRLMWRRATRPAPPPQLPETAQRLERIEQAVDAIAIEVERVSEGQRFVTRLLSEGQPQHALAAGKREEERVVASRE
jgi:Na+-transporting methylmalonyl-CoA/oxaloacetate decarboxylase gamma subunit